MKNKDENNEVDGLPEEPLSLTPVNFFQLSVDCHYLSSDKNFNSLSSKQRAYYKLPSMEALCFEEQFADLFIAWNQEGISIFIDVYIPFEEASYPSVSNGDSIEIFIDTRDVKTSGFNTRYCHHFFFLPEAFEGIQAGEITRFRTEDSHELCNGIDLKVQTKHSRRGCELNIFIPSQCLHGYDPELCDHIGFTYRINRAKGAPQHFSVVTEEYPIEQQPSLWSSLKLIS